MTGKVTSRKLKTGGLAFGTRSVFLSILVLSCIFLLFGCNSQQAKVAEANRIKNMPADARKADLQKLLDRKFENQDAHYELAQFYQAEGLWPKAEYHYNVALGFDPSNAEAQAAMVRLFLDSGDTAKSKTYADVHINQARASATQSLRLAMAFQKQQLDEYALACYQQALHLAPSSAKVHKHIGFYYLTKNDNTKAKEHLTRSFQLDPKQPEVAGELGRLGVEVRIPRKTESKIKKLGTESDKESKILLKHGLIQVEQTEKK